MLLDWLDRPKTDAGIRYLDADGEWEFHSWAQLAERARDAGAVIDAYRRSPGPVCICVPTGPDFPAAFFGALLAGETPSPLPPATLMQEQADYREHVASMLRVARPSLIVADEQHAPILAEAAERAGIEARPIELAHAERSANPALGGPPEVALLQFTSGSSGTPRGSRITRANLEANVRMIADWLEFDGDVDRMATWLPLYHDMGLIGALVTPALTTIDLMAMRPDQFIRRPRHWIECFGHHGATIGVGPSFGFAFANRRLRPRDVEGMDFSRWRVAVCGAERVDADVLSRFARLLEPHGFRRETFVPAYGLAEATLAVTGGRFGEPSPVVSVDWATLEPGRRVDIHETSELGDDGDGLVGCGTALPGVSVDLVDPDGQPVPPRHLGEIVVRGPTVARGYLGEQSDDTGSTRFLGEDSVRTGDSAFEHDGELFVVGRIGDSLNVRGRVLHAEDLESALGKVEGVPRRRSVVISGALEGEETVVALSEASPGPWARDLAASLSTQAGSGVRVKVMCAEPGTIRRTSSGKPRRKVMWQMLLQGDLDAHDVVEARDSEIVEERVLSAVD